MKWFFLVLLVLMATGFEALILEGTHEPSPHRMATALGFGLISLALFVYWVVSYFLNCATQEKGLELARSMLTLSFTAYCIMLGAVMITSDACAYMSPNGTNSTAWTQLLADATNYLQERGWCASLGYSFLLLGGAFSWPTVKPLFGGFLKRIRTRSL